MIKISARDEGETVKMSFEAHGEGEQLIEEAFAIVTEIPKELRMMNPVLFYKLMHKIAEETRELEREEETDGFN